MVFAEQEILWKIVVDINLMRHFKILIIKIFRKNLFLKSPQIFLKIKSEVIN